MLGGFLGLALAVVAYESTASAQVVPGAGKKIEQVGDDFEDEKWSYTFNNPKSSDEQDKNQRLPGGFSINGRWAESAMRGHPDVIQRVATPPGGLPGSNGALMFRTLHAGIPGVITHTGQQDDLLANVSTRVGNLSASRTPSVTTRVYVPPFEEFEKRTGNSFGFRLACTGLTQKKESFWGGTEVKPYWPGMFIWFDSKSDGRHTEDSAHFIMRAGPIGQDLRVPDHEITGPGWWTLGMTCTPDGQIHFYIREGIEDLRPEDRVGSYWPYSYRCQQVQTFFYDVCNLDNGKEWSTSWIVDDPAVYVLK
jgi:hypothetical protein